MKNLNIVTSKLFVTIFCLLIINLKHAGAAPPTPAQCNAALTIATTSSMDFGSYIGGTTGTIAMPPLIGGAMVYSTVIGAPESSAMPTTFELTTSKPQCGNGNLVVPASFTVANGGPSITITINPVTEIDPPATNFKVGKKPYILTIGGTLQAVAGSAPGTYTGPLDITFTYP
jgi:hypothetical protein